MPDAAEQVGISLSDYMALGEDAWAEVIDGEVIRRDMSAVSFRHTVVIDNVLDVLKAHVRKHDAGVVFGDGLTFALSVVGETVRSARIPDVCFIRREKLLADFDYDKPNPTPAPPTLPSR